MHRGFSQDEAELAGEEAGGSWSTSEMGLTRKGALIAAGTGAGLGLIGSLGYLADVEKKAFDRGFLDAQEGRPYAPAMEGDVMGADRGFLDAQEGWPYAPAMEEDAMGAEGLLPDWLSYLGIGLGVSGITGVLAQLVQSPLAAARVKKAYAEGYAEGSPSSTSSEGEDEEDDDENPWDSAHGGSIPGYEHIAAMSGTNGLPYVDTPGTPLPRDDVRDGMILRALTMNGIPTRQGANLDYAQSEALYHTVRDYFDHVQPLMQTERWMAEFVEKNGMTYIDHDGRRYRMQGGVRKQV